MITIFFAHYTSPLGYLDLTVTPPYVSLTARPRVLFLKNKAEKEGWSSRGDNILLFGDQPIPAKVLYTIKKTWPIF